MEANHKWSIYQDSKHIDSGTRWGTERSVLEAVMAEFIEHPKFRGSVSFRFSVGSTFASSFGDEIGATVGCLGSNPDSDAGGFTYPGSYGLPKEVIQEALDGMAKPIVRELIKRSIVGATPVKGARSAKEKTEQLRKAFGGLGAAAIGATKQMRALADAAQKHEEEELRNKILRDQGFISQDVYFPTEEELGLDPDRERELRAIRDQYRSVRPLRGYDDVDCRHPSISSLYDQRMRATKYVCSDCGRGYAYSDLQKQYHSITLGDVRRILS